MGLPKKCQIFPRSAQGAYHSVFVDEYFAGFDGIKKTYIYKALKKAVAKVCEVKEVVEKNNKDIVRLILLMLFITLLFPSARSTISWDLVKYCDELEKIEKYEWAKAVKNFLNKSIKTLKRKGRRNEQGSSDITRCVKCLN